MPCMAGEATWEELPEMDDVPFGDGRLFVRLSRVLGANPFVEGKSGIKFGAQARTGVAGSRQSIADNFVGFEISDMDKWMEPFVTVSGLIGKAEDMSWDAMMGGIISEWDCPDKDAKPGGMSLGGCW